MLATPVQWLGTFIFALAILHTFSTHFFLEKAKAYPSGSIGENLFHFLGEVEAVFGIWAAVFLFGFCFLEGYAIYDSSHRLVGGAVHYLEAQNFTEAAFVFVIMCMAGTRPVILLAETLIQKIAQRLPLPPQMSFFVSALIMGPLLGSLITEPAAMTVTALILLDYFFSGKMSLKFKYATLGLLFVNISVGGALTHFAAPPVLMVASKWDWGMGFMMGHFGFKAIIAISISTLGTAFYFKNELQGPLVLKEKHENRLTPVWWVTLIHVLFMVFVVLNAHHISVFLGAFLFFIGFTSVTAEYQDSLKLKESLMVGFFLAGLVTLGSVQAWWLRPLLSSLGDFALYSGAVALTAITDNAALTYLGSLVDLSDSAKYNLVAGAIAGGGLTVIANAPNPAGYGILKSSFKDGINPLYLFIGALSSTAIVCLCFQLLPDL